MDLQEVRFTEELKNMGFKNFSLNIIFRLLTIVAVIALIIYFIFVHIDFIIAFFSIGLLSFLIVNLFFYINKTNRDFTNFLASFVNNDFTIKFSVHRKGKNFEKLYQTFDLIQKKFSRLNFEKEQGNQHLQNLVEHVDFGIVSIDENLDIHLVNQAFKMMINLPYLSKGQSISQLDEILFKTIKSIKANEKRLIKIKTNNSVQELAIHANIYKLNAREFKLISIKNIYGELDAKEMESYQKLIRVLTHEIMNTLSPIISLSGTMNQSIKDLVKDQNSIDIETGNYLKEGIEAIHDRSEGLLKFTESYRKLMKLPKPNLKLIEILSYFNQLRTLLEPQLRINNIDFTINIEEDQKQLFIDPELFEQVLINIYKNAIESFSIKNSKVNSKPEQSLHPTIKTHIYHSREAKSCIKISDNGSGMDKESIENAFIPFYTTKEEGSGIGLSLSKQIMLLHKGSIILESELGIGTEVYLILNP